MGLPSLLIECSSKWNAVIKFEALDFVTAMKKQKDIVNLINFALVEF